MIVGGILQEREMSCEVDIRPIVFICSCFMFVYWGHGVSWLKHVTYSCPGRIPVRQGFFVFSLISSTLIKEKLTLEHARKAEKYISTISLTSALDGNRWSTPRPGCFTLGKETWYILYRRLGRAQGCSGRVRKISPPPGFDPWII